MIGLIEQAEDRSKLTSALALVEVRLGIRRRQYAGDTPHADAESAIHSLVEESRRLVEHPITSAVLEIAVGLVDRHNLRSLDSNQLATAISAKERLHDGEPFTFIGSDVKLLSAAKSEGLGVWNPCSV